MIKCIFCNEDGFHWEKVSDEKWRLFKDDKIHDCRSDKSQPYYQEEDWEPEPIPPMCDSCDDYGCPHCNGDYSPA